MKFPKIVKRILLTISTLLLLLIASAFAIPYFFKDKIVAKIKEGINKEINAKVDFKDVDISFMRHFPKISVKLENLDVVGVGIFDGVRLFNTEGLDLALNFWSVWNGGNPYEVSKIYVDKPFINVVKLADGTANYDISKSKAEKKSEPSEFKLSLAHYEINDGTILYDDHALGFYMGMRGIKHEGSGEMTASVYDLDTETHVDSLTVSYGAMTYLSNAKTDLKTLLNVNMDLMKFVLKSTKAKVNDMALETGGFLQMKPNDDMDMDFTFKAPSNNFKDFLSVIPAAFTKNYSDVKADGTFAFDGFVRGTYNGDKKQYPAFALNTKVQNGSFQYPALPMGCSEINTDISLALPSSDFDAFKIDVPKFHIKVGNNPFDAVFKLRTPVSDPDLDLQARGTLNLADLPKAIPMNDIQNLTGIINADVSIKTLMSYVEKKMYDKVQMQGALKVNGMNVKTKDYPSVLINDLAMNFTPNFVGVNNFNAKLGRSDIQADGTIDNLLAFFSTNRTMTGKLNFASNLFDATEWVKPSTATPSVSTAKSTTNAPADDTQRPFDRFDFTVNGKINRLIYDKYDITNSAAAGHFTPNKFTFNNFQTKIGNSDMSGSGTLTGVFDWLFDNKMLGGTLFLNSNYMDLNQFMTETPQSTATPQSAPNTATEPFVIPKNVDVAVVTNMKKVIYTNMDLTNVKGKLAIKNQEVKIVDGEAGVFGGTTDIDGGYNTQDPKKPVFDLAFDLHNIDFQQSFSKLNTFQKLAPIGQFMKGKFNTRFEMEGALGKDLSPDYNSLTMSGFFQTIQGAVSGFKPLEDVANKLNISELKALDLKDTKNWFEVKNGAVEVKEFDKKVKDIALKIGGKHSLTNEMAYFIKGKVPRKLLEKNAVGAAAGAGYNAVIKEAQKLGINLNNSEFVNVQFDITGSMLQPKIGFKVLGGDGQATVQDAAKDAVNSVVNKAKDSVTTRANEELDKAKLRAKEYADRAADSAARVLNAKVEQAKNDAIERAKREAGAKAGEKVGSELDKILEKTGGNDKLKTGTDKVKEKLDGWNPFGKKKKEETPPPTKDNGGGK